MSESRKCCGCQPLVYSAENTPLSSRLTALACDCTGVNSFL